MNKITKEFLESEIISVEYNRLQGTLTHCTITVKSGFVFTGESVCVDPNNFDQELGEKFAYEQELDQMWMPYSFWLRKVLAEADYQAKLDEAQNLIDSYAKRETTDSGSVEYIGPAHPTTYSKDIADLNNYGLDVSFVAVDEASELEGPERCADSFDEVEATEAYDDIKAEIARPIDADEILQIAEETIAQRGVMYDSTGQQQERSMGKVVAMFNALTGHELTNEQGWKFMCLLKLARSEQGEFSIDSFFDLAAYAALAGEEAAKRNQQ